MTDFDSPWKEILDRFFRAFLAYFFPKAHADRYNRHVVTLVVLADDREDWRPNSFGFERWDFSV